MGVVSNKNNINELMLGIEALPQIMTSVSNCAEALALVQTSVRSMLPIATLKDITSSSSTFSDFKTKVATL